MRLALTLLASAAVLSGCSTTALSGLDAKSTFSCAAPDGVTCMSVSGIYANSRAGNLPGQQRNEMIGAGAAAGQQASVVGGGPRPAIPAPNAAAMNPTPTGSPANPRDMQAPYMGMPVRTAERVLRIWMSPYEDADGDLHDQRYFYVTVSSGRWQVENNRIAPRSAFRQIRPLSVNNPANREASATQSPQAQAAQMVLPQGGGQNLDADAPPPGLQMPDD